MTEAEWLASENLFLLWRHGGQALSERRVRLYAAALCRLLWDCLDAGSRTAVDVTERYVDGDASDDEWNITCTTASKDYLFYIARTDHVCSIARLAVADLASFVFSPNRFIQEASLGVELAYPGEGNRRELVILRDVFGNPFRPVGVKREWLTPTVATLADGIYAEKAFDRLPVLADGLQDAGCDNEDVLNHCRDDGPHVRGCWVIDLLTGRK